MHRALRSAFLCLADAGVLGKPRSSYQKVATYHDKGNQEKQCGLLFFRHGATLLIALMSVESWLHKSRRSLVTTRRGCFTVVMLLLIPIPIPIAVSCVLWRLYQRCGTATEIMIITVWFSSYLATSFACFKVYRIIRHHQQQLQANETSRNFGRQAIVLAKYKKSVASMLYIVVLLSFCFLPYVFITAIKLSLGDSSGVDVTYTLSSIPVFLSSSLDPGLYLWRMKDIRNGVKQLFC